MNDEQQCSDDPWAPATVPSEQPTAYEQQQADYQQQLTDAGYGDEQRARYIAESGQDPEYAACMWDEEVVPAAEAAGLIAENPSPFSPTEEATLAARDAAMSEFWEQHPGFNPTLLRQAMEYGDQKAREALGDKVAEHMLSTPLEHQEVPTHEVDEEIDF